MPIKNKTSLSALSKRAICSSVWAVMSEVQTFDAIRVVGIDCSFEKLGMRKDAQCNTATDSVLEFELVNESYAKGVEADGA